MYDIVDIVRWLLIFVGLVIAGFVGIVVVWLVAKAVAVGWFSTKQYYEDKRIRRLLSSRRRSDEDKQD